VQSTILTDVRNATNLDQFRSVIGSPEIEPKVAKKLKKNYEIQTKSG